MTFKHKQKTYTLRFKSTAIKVLQEHWGFKTLSELFNSKIATMNDSLTIDDITAIFWAGIKHEIPDITLDRAQKMIDEIDEPYITLTAKIIQALTSDTTNPNIAQIEEAKKKKQRQDK